jgi:hypothetical protein
MVYEQLTKLQRCLTSDGAGAGSALLCHAKLDRLDRVLA